MSEPSAWIEFAKWFGQAAVVGFGWAVVHRLSAQRDRDKARREMVAKSADALAEAVDSLLANSRQYHTAPRDRAMELRVKMDLQDAAMRVTSLSDICVDRDVLAPCRTDIGGIRRAVTGSHFEDEHTEPLAETSAQLESIADAVMRAKRSLLRLKHLQFPAHAG